MQCAYDELNEFDSACWVKIYTDTQPSQYSGNVFKKGSSLNAALSENIII